MEGAALIASVVTTDRPLIVNPSNWVLTFSDLGDRVYVLTGEGLRGCVVDARDAVRVDEERRRQRMMHFTARFAVSDSLCPGGAPD
jgi:hypothetical protein